MSREAVRRTPRPETRPTRQDCPDCGGQVLVAITCSGLDVVVDAAALTTLGELAATMAGCPTYTWHLIPDHLVRRYPLVIRSRPAGTPRQTVHARHTHGTAWPCMAPPPKPEPCPWCHPDDPPGTPCVCTAPPY